MFKKMFLVMCLVLFCSSLAMAVSFTVSGVDVEFGGLGFGNYNVVGLEQQQFELNDGERTEITNPVDLFSITFTETSSGIGSVNATIDLVKPDEGEVTQDGFYAGLSIVGNYDFTLGFINWGDPVSWYFDAGTLTLDLVDINYICNPLFDNTFTIAGLFSFEADTNFGSPTPAPVPEPATMLLLGVGLFGLGGISKKKLFKNLV